MYKLQKGILFLTMFIGISIQLIGQQMITSEATSLTTKNNINEMYLFFIELIILSIR